MHHTQPETLLTIEQACQRLSLGRTSLFNAIRDRKLRAVKLGRATRIAESELARFLASLPDARPVIGN